MDVNASTENRYNRQMLLPQIGIEGQRRLAAARVLLVGCGALGTAIAEHLVRAGIGFLRIADRDMVELSNLHRQVLFDEEDARQALPKAVAAANRLGRINSSVVVQPQVMDVHGGNIEDLCGLGSAEPVNCILDGTDNIETRYLINDVAIKHGLPWVYGACVGTEGRVMPILPGRTACLRCLFREAPGPGELPTCDTVGVLGPAAAMAGALQATAAIKLLSGNPAALPEEMVVFDLWANRYHAISTAGGRRDDCPCCGQRRFEYLESVAADRAVSLCGRNAVQIAAAKGKAVDLDAVSGRLAAAGRVERTAYFLRCQLHDPEGILLTVFTDGRTIVQGTQDAARARSIAARFVGF